jgi:cell division ATPase FtsA
LQNQIERDEDVLWTDFVTAFDGAYTDTTKRQKAQANIQKLGIIKNEDLDKYIAAFKHTAKEAGYN